MARFMLASRKTQTLIMLLLRTTRCASTITEPQQPHHYWEQINRWKYVLEHELLGYPWQKGHSIQGKRPLMRFLHDALPPALQSEIRDGDSRRIMTRKELLDDFQQGISMAPLADCLTPHFLSLIDWQRPLSDPLLRASIPRRSTLLADHSKPERNPQLRSSDSPWPNMVYRYPDRIIYYAADVCRLSCRFCNGPNAIGTDMDVLTKARFDSGCPRWDDSFTYIERNPAIVEVIVSDGANFPVRSAVLASIVRRLLSVTHVKRMRYITGQFGSCPMRVLDKRDDWFPTFISLSDGARAMGKQICLHTRIDHPNQINWVTELSARYLFESGVIVRNETVLRRDINDDVAAMSTLIRRLGDLNFQPYYVYQAAKVSGTEYFRTPLSAMLHLEQQIRGTVAGVLMPSFVVDLPEGGGKRLANSFDTYDPESGISTWRAPGLTGDRVFELYDPTPSSR